MQDSFETFCEHKPLPLITYNGLTRSFELNEEALEFLRSLKSPIAVVSVAGLYRTGKSYLLNRVLLNRKEGFNVGSTVNACTKGLWIWGAPIQGKTKNGQPCNVLIVDSEGIGSLEEDSNHDSRVFSLAVLLSSYFIYNSVGAIDENAIHNLSLVVNITKHIHLRASESTEEDSSEFSAYFPGFLWVVRDFTLRLTDQEGRPFTSKQYLERALQPQKGFSDSVEEKNRIRRVLTGFFKDRDCCTLVRPTASEKDLQRLSSIDMQDLRSEFVEQVVELRRKVIENARVKTLNGTELSGEMLANLLVSYISAMNSGVVPTIENAWSYICKNQNSMAFEESKQVYTRILKSVRKLPVEPEDLKMVHKEAKTTALEHLNKKAVGEEKLQLTSELTKFIAESYEGMKIENESTCKKECLNYLKENFSTIQEKVRSGTVNSLPEFERLLQEFSNNYLKTTADGPGKKRFLSEFCREKITEFSHQTLKTLQSEFEVQVSSSDCKIQHLQKELTQAKNNLYIQASEKSKLESDLESLKVETQSKEDSLVQEVSLLKSQKEDLEEQVKNSSHTCKATSEEIKQLKQTNENLEEKLKEVKRDALQQQNDLEQQIALLKQQVAFTENSLEDFKAREKHSNEKIKQLKSEQSNSIKSTQSKHEEQLNSLTAQLEKTQQDLHNCESQLEEKETLYDQLSADFKELQLQKSREQSELELTLESLKKQLSEKDKEHKSQTEEIEEEHLNSTSRLRARLNETEKKLRSTEELLRNDIAVWAQDNAILVQKIEFLEQEIEDLKCKRAEEKRQYESTIATLENLKSSNSDAEEQLQKFKTEHLEEISRIKQEFESQKKQLNSRIEELLEHHSEIETKLKIERNDWRLEKQKYHERIEELEKYKENQSSKEPREDPRVKRVPVLEREIENLKESHKEEVESMKVQHEEAFMKLKTFYEQEKERFEARVLKEKQRAEKNSEIVAEEYEERLKQESRMHDDEISNLQEEFKELEDYYELQISEYKDKLSLAANRSESLENYIVNLKEQLNSAYSSHSSKIEVEQDKFNKQRFNLLERVEKLSNEVSEKEKTIVSLKHSKENAEKLANDRLKIWENLNEKYYKEKGELLEKLTKLNEMYDEVNAELTRVSSKAKTDNALAENEINQLNKRIQELEEALEQSDKKYSATISQIKQESQSQNLEHLQSLYQEKENLQFKVDEKKKQLKDLRKTTSREINELEREKAVLEEKLNFAEKKQQEIENYYQRQLQKYQNQPTAKKAPDFTKQQEEYQIQILKLEKEISALHNAAERDKALWENKFNFLKEQRDSAKTELVSAQEKFNQVISQLQKKGNSDKEKLQSDSKSLVSSLEAKYNAQVSDMQTRHQNALNELRERHKQEERKLHQKYEDLENENLALQDTITLLEKRIKNWEENEKKIKQDLETEKQDKERRLNNLLEKFSKERETWKIKISECEKKLKEAEALKSQMFIQHEKERAKWALEKDNITSQNSETRKQLSDLLKRQENLKRENQKLKAPKTLSSSCSYEEFSKMRPQSGRSTPTNSTVDFSPRLISKRFMSPRSNSSNQK